ncbi:MAG TPA: GH3 auxin-responsive promoter family protein [Bacteroidales bacterium]|nr:GH3 auxin-responsive promoter family protein [Bacteroidales bacterium]HRZ48578.1 GH3 auxin-responsive promoter family protein [Bacteroidales bacterium]
MPILNAVLSWFMKKRMHQIDLFLKYPVEVQLEWMKKLMQRAAFTEWGQKYEFSSVETPDTYKNRVPLQDYNQIQPYIDRIRKGEQNILWPAKIVWFARSSGTTGSKSKYIPVSNEALEECHFKGGKDLLSIYCNNNPDTRIFDGKTLGLGGTHDYSSEKPGPYHGDVSAVIMQNLPFWFELIRTPDLTTALMEDWEQKLLRIAEITSQENVTIISGVPSWMLLLLNKVMEINGTDLIEKIWPNLEMFAHGGVNFTPYKDKFRSICPGSMNYIETYNASEGFFGIQDSNQADDMLLMLDYGIFYEFIPLDTANDEYPDTIWLDQVETDVPYAMVITTNSGLWRYRIGDVVTFTSLNPFRIRILGRTRSFINAFGEELMVENAEKAMKAACLATNASVMEFTAAPVYLNGNESGAHQWIIEFSKEPADLGKFTLELDRSLQNLNSDYEAKRYKDLILGLPQIIKAPQGTFYRWMKQKGKLGGQHKVPRLHNNRLYVDEIIHMLG